MAGFALFTAASAACAMAANAAILILTRCVQGLAAAILVPNSPALLSHACADHKARGRVLGVAWSGALVAQSGSFMAGPHAPLLISASVLIAAAAAIWCGAHAELKTGAAAACPKQR